MNNDKIARALIILVIIILAPVAYTAPKPDCFFLGVVVGLLATLAALWTRIL